MIAGDPVKLAERGGAGDIHCINNLFGKMVTLRPLLFFTVVLYIFGYVCAKDETVQRTGSNVDLPTKIELLEGVSLKFPESNNTDKLFSLEVGSQGDHVEGKHSNK